MTGLVCRECAKDHAVAAHHVCDECFGPLEVAYDYDGIASGISRSEIASRSESIWRFAELLPSPEVGRVDIGAGGTRLRAAPRLAAELGLRRLWLKDDGSNPTHSFKDRVVTVALSVARSFGYSTAACASTGNLANAVAAHAAASGMASIVFIPHDLEAAKVVATAVYGGMVVAVDGSYDDVNRLCVELADAKDWAFVNVGLRPYYAEGSKTLAFEVVEQLGWRAPDAMVIPIASGSLLTKVAKGLDELWKVGLLPDPPLTSLHGAQAEGCAPVAAAFARGDDDVHPVKPATVAKSLAIGNPADGIYALEEARDSGGTITAVEETAVAEGMLLLARTEGLFTETAGGVTIAALERLVRSGAIPSDQEVVALITGIGLKTTDALQGVGPTHRISASVGAVDEILEAP